MPRAFDITANTTSAKLDASGRAELGFTVSNTLGKSVRARAVCQPDGKTQAQWLTIAGDVERDYTHDGTQTYAVKVAVPPGTPEGTYAFHLLVSSVLNPDEDYAHGPPVSFTVAPAAATPRRKIPWWLIALAGGVLVIGIGSFALAKLVGGKAPGATCTKDADCPSDQKCAALSVGTLTCRLKPGEKCKNQTDCSSLFCPEDKGKCSRDDGLCESPADCRSPFQCTNGRCALADGQSCFADQDCISGDCNRTCQPAVAQCIPPCPWGSFCASGRCIRVSGDVFQRNFLLQQPR